MKPYRKFAEVYDRMGADHHSVHMVEYIVKLMDKFESEPTNGLDLCCGTGTAIKLLTAYGLDMTGLDRSASMLKEAKKKLRGHGVRLVKGELPRFRIYQNKSSKKLSRFDLVTSFYDSLNYMASEQELKTTFRSVFLHLRPGGHFIFDMNTPQALKTIWDSQVWGGVKDDVAWIFRNRHDEANNEADCMATFFVKRGKLWERFDETHTERAYPHPVMKRILRAAGFTIRGYYRCFSQARVTEKTDRICVVARRPVSNRTR